MTKANSMQVKICPECGQVFSVTAAGLELMYAHVMREHQLAADAASDAIDSAVVEERTEALPQPLPQCH